MNDFLSLNQIKGFHSRGNQRREIKKNMRSNAMKGKNSELNEEIIKDLEDNDSSVLILRGRNSRIKEKNSLATHGTIVLALSIDLL